MCWAPREGVGSPTRGAWVRAAPRTVEEVESRQCSLISFGFKRDTACYSGQSPGGQQGHWAPVPPGHSTGTLSRSAHFPGSASPSVTCGVVGARVASGTPCCSATWPCPKMASCKVSGTFEGCARGNTTPRSGLLPSPGRTHIVTRSLLQGASSLLNKSRYYLALEVTEWLDSRGAIHPSQVAAETWDPGVDNRGPPGPSPPVRPRPPPPRPPPAGRAGGSSALSPGLDGSQHAGKKRAASGHLRPSCRSTPSREPREPGSSVPYGNQNSLIL